MPLIKSPDLFTAPPVKYQLRPYQKEAVDAGLRFFHERPDKNVLMVLPTGSGKSIVIAEIAAKLKQPLLILSPSVEITTQNLEKIHSYGITDVEVYSASFGRKKISRITLATIGSVYRKPEHFRHFKYAIIDECHQVGGGPSMYKEFFRNMIGCRIIGLTASPFRLGNNSYGTIIRFLTRCSPRFFHEVVHVTQIQALIDHGFLAKMEYFTIGGFNSDSLKVNSTGSGYTDESIKKYYAEIMFTNKLLKTLNRLLEINRRGILCFTQFIDEAKTVVEAINMQHGASTAAIVTGKTEKKERAQIIKDYKSGKIKLIANVGTMTTGFDYPELDTCVIARPTRSLALWMQMVGRVARPHPSKEYSMVIDLCDNFKMFGKMENIKVEKNDKGHWAVTNQGVQLTNVYF